MALFHHSSDLADKQSPCFADDVPYLLLLTASERAVMLAAHAALESCERRSKSFFVSFRARQGAVRPDLRVKLNKLGQLCELVSDLLVGKTVGTMKANVVASALSMSWVLGDFLDQTEEAMRSLCPTLKCYDRSFTSFCSEESWQLQQQRATTAKV
eukprot:5430804-Amphidinium_carterae.2